MIHSTPQSSASMSYQPAVPFGISPPFSASEEALTTLSYAIGAHCLGSLLWE